MRRPASSESDFDLKGSPADRARSTYPTAALRHPELRGADGAGRRSHNPYTKLFEERIIFLGVQIDDASANDVMAQLLCLESMDPDRDISIYINSPGGSFTAMTAIYDTMQFVKPDIQTICMGQAASAAAVILAAGTPASGSPCRTRASSSTSRYTEGGGQASDIEIQANEILRMRTVLESMLARHTGKHGGGSVRTSSATRSSPPSSQGVRSRRPGHQNRKASRTV